METLIIIGFVVVFIVLFCFFSDLYSGKKEGERKRKAAEKQWEEENKRLTEIREKLCKNPVFHDIMEKIHLEFDEILAKASVTPILKGKRHYYSVNIFSYAVKTGEHLGTDRIFWPNKSGFSFSSYNMDEMPRDYVIALAKEISADFYNRYKDNFPETPLFAKIETPSQNTDGETYEEEEGIYFIKIDLTSLHPKYNTW